MEGLNSLSSIVEIYLVGNKIDKIEGIDHLTSLDRSSLFRVRGAVEPFPELNLFKSDLIISLFTGIDEFNALIIRLIGDISVISSIFILNYSFESFPTIMELQWKQYLLELHILSANGIEIHCNNFETIKRKIDPDLVGMAVTGISDLIREVTGSKEDLNMIDQKDFKILFKKSSEFVIFLLATEPLEIYEFKLNDLLEDITEEFGKRVENWAGDLIKFKGIEKCVLDHFT